MIFHNMLLQDEGVNKNEDIEKSVIISSKTGAEVNKSVIGFMYANREFDCRLRRIVFAGKYNLFC